MKAVIKFMNIRSSLAILTAKLIIPLCRLLRHGGTTLPGRVAIKLYPNIIKKISQKFKIIMVTGTNGKTTTTRMIGKILKENNVRFVTNNSGANLTSGLATTLISAINANGKPKAPFALLEVDEAALKRVSSSINPDVLVITNFFRDQLDRYGELYSTVAAVKTAITKFKNTHLLLNSDDSLCAPLGKGTNLKVSHYGVENEAYNFEPSSANSDASFCIYCKKKYEYRYRVYGHLGGFFCSGCGYARPTTVSKCTKILKLDTETSEVEFKLPYPSGISSQTIKIGIPGLYNVYNALAAATCGTVLGFPPSTIVKSLEKQESSFGRMETITSETKNIKLILVKNPTGFNQVLSFVSTDQRNIHLALLLNDNFADGTDISWIWDVDFEVLNHMQHRISKIYTSGTRCEDLAVRLKYAGLNVEKIEIIKDYKVMLEKVLEDATCKDLYILPTYTAMLDVRKVLVKKFNLKEFWN